jgi:aspartyl/asparaginyl-tRNA synthetase
VQAVIDNKDEVEKLRGLQIGTVIELTGKVVEEQRAPGGVELHEASLNVLVPVHDEPPVEIDKPLSHKSENLDTLFDYRPIGLRNLQETKIFKIRSEVLDRVRQYLRSKIL